MTSIRAYDAHRNIDSNPSPTLFSREFSLLDRVALVTGGCGGLGLECALALVEAGARAVYCVDLPEQPTEKWQKVREYASRFAGKAGEGRLEYISADVTNQVFASFTYHCRSHHDNTF